MLRCILQNIPKYVINYFSNCAFSVKIASKLWLLLLMVHVNMIAPICTNNILNHHSVFSPLGDLDKIE